MKCSKVSRTFILLQYTLIQIQNLQSFAKNVGKIAQEKAVTTNETLTELTMRSCNIITNNRRLQEFG